MYVCGIAISGIKHHLVSNTISRIVPNRKASNVGCILGLGRGRIGECILRGPHLQSGKDSDGKDT